jgi:hypothetical protein
MVGGTYSKVLRQKFWWKETCLQRYEERELRLSASPDSVTDIRKTLTDGFTLLWLFHSALSILLLLSRS